MGFLDILNKKKLPNEQPISGTIEKTTSYAVIIPKNAPLPDRAEAFADKVLALPFLTVISKNIKDNGDAEFIAEYRGEEFKFLLSIDSFSLPTLFRIGHDFTDEEIAAMESAESGLYCHMTFGKNNSSSYHLQIKLMCAMIDNPAGIADISGERILSGRWAKLAAKSEIPPAPSYLYSIQCICGDNGSVWIHTHGLNRCGGIELEILNANKDNYNSLAHVITALADRIITNSSFAEEYEPVFAVRLSNDEPIVSTWVRWQTAVKMLPKKLLGGAADREDSHNENTGVLFAYRSPNDCDNRKLTPITEYSRELEHNPMLMLSNEETERMRRLAMERIEYLKALFNSRDKYEKFAALIKVGLEVDEQYRDGDMKEHIWFELKELHEDGFSAELTQPTYYVEALKPGDIRECKFEEITDWTVYTDEQAITPDSVYRLEK